MSIDLSTLPESANSKYLKSHGWHLIEAKQNGSGFTKYWYHPKYGTHTQTAALGIQKTKEITK